MKEVGVIGLGPAGITASIYLLRAKIEIVCFEKLSPGGQIALTDRVENYPGFPEGISGYELAQNFKKQLEKLSPLIVNQEVTQVQKDKSFTIYTSSSRYEVKAIVIATGARPRRLGVKGEEEFIGKGVSYCATCDGMFFRNKVVGVVGGGNSAVEEAIYLSKLVKKVYLIHRRDRLRADKILQERIFGLPNVEFCLGSLVEEIGGETKVEYVSLKEVKTKQLKRIPLEGLFIFVGYQPNTEFLGDFIELSPEGYIITDQNLLTSREGVFAAGDVRFGSLKQVVSACGEGAKAGLEAARYVEKLKGTLYI